MRRCPYCAEEIQDEAKLCRWCHKTLKPVNISFNNILCQLSFILLIIATGSFFLPFARFQFPMIGTQSFSGAGILVQLVKTKHSVQQTKETGKLSIDIRSLRKIMDTAEGSRVFRSKTIYLLIPVGLCCGVISYGLLILIAFFLWIKRQQAVGMTALGCFLLLMPFLASLFLLNDLLQTTIIKSIDRSLGNPFADLTTTFMQGIRIEPAAAIYLLASASLLLAIINPIKKITSL